MSLRNHRRIFLLAIQDEAQRFGRYYKYVFKRLHINPRRIRLSYRSSLAVIGYVGRRRPNWIRHMSRKQTRGPSYASARIPIYGRKYMKHPPPEKVLKWRSSEMGIPAFRKQVSVFMSHFV